MKHGKGCAECPQCQPGAGTTALKHTMALSELCRRLQSHRELPAVGRRCWDGSCPWEFLIYGEMDEPSGAAGHRAGFALLSPTTVPPGLVTLWLSPQVSRGQAQLQLHTWTKVL